MRIVAVILNVLLLGTVVYLFATKGAPSSDERWLVTILLAAPAGSIVALLMAPGTSWLSLYFQRKALEEKQKIALLQVAAKK